MEPRSSLPTSSPWLMIPRMWAQTHWTFTKLCGWLRDNKQFDLSCRTFVRYMHEHIYARRIRPRIPELRNRNVDRPAGDLRHELAGMLEGPGNDIFFGDEAGFQGDPRPTRQNGQARQPARLGLPMAVISGRTSWMRSIQRPVSWSACSPRIATPRCSRHFHTIAADAPAAAGRQVLLVLDNPSWHNQELGVASHQTSLSSALQSRFQPDRTILAAPQKPLSGRIPHRRRTGTRR